MKKVERRPRDNDVEEMSTGSEVDGDAYLTGSSQFSTESEGQSEYEELDEMHEDGERTSTTLVDESMRNATLPMFYDPRNDSTTLPPEGEMVYDSSAYAMLHRLTLTWPALSFDFFQEKEANSPQGAAASGEYPISVHAVVGTQCENDCDNALYALRMYNMYRTYVRDEEAPDMDLNLRNKWEGDDDSDDGSESDIDDEAGFRDPCVESTGIVKVSVGSINRVRHHPHTSMLALWCGNEVQVYSSKQALRSIASPISKFALSQEGFALDWSKTHHNPNLLISGNTAGSLNVFLDVALAGDASSVSTTVPYSIEDVQTSPTQPNIFMAGGTDGIVEVFDLRERLTGKMSWKVTRERKPRKGMKGSFGLDVNAIAWHPMQMTSHLVATGGDDGAVRVWDLRSLRNKGASSPESVLVDISQHHCSSINSIQWSPHNESVCTVCSDSEVSIYDFSLERDFQEEFEMLNISSVDQAPEWLTRIQKGDEEGLGAIPSQLLFEHGGLRFAKEVRMHPSIPGLFGVTHENGLHIFRPCNWQSLMQ